MSDLGLDWLWNQQDKSEEPDELVAGGDFIQGFTGYWTCARLRSAWIEEGVDLDGLGIKYLAKNDIQGSGSFVYWANEEDAMKAKDDLGLRFPPRQVWRWEMPTSSMIGFGGDDPSAVFGASIGMDATVTSPKSKNRVPFQMILLPSAIQSLALLSGKMTEKVFDYESLLDAIPDDVTEEIEEQFAGTKSGYTQSDLWRARAAIWEALGEENPMAYFRYGSGSDFDVSSDNLLNQALQLLYFKTPVWGRVVRVNEPRVDAVTKSGNHLTVPAVVQLFKNREDAENSLGVQETNESGVKMPESWAEGNASVKDWTDFVKDFTKGLGTSKMVVRKKVTEKASELEDYACTVDEVMEAWEALNA